MLYLFIFIVEDNDGVVLVILKLTIESLALILIGGKNISPLGTLATASSKILFYETFLKLLVLKKGLMYLFPVTVKEY